MKKNKREMFVFAWYSIEKWIV